MMSPATLFGRRLARLNGLNGRRKEALTHSGEPFAIDKRVFKPRRLKESWYDPRYGCTYYVHTTANAAFQTSAPPTSGRGNDWILILEEE